MLKSYAEAVCWLAGHEGAVLVVRTFTARVVDKHYRADGVARGAARALLVARRVRWFDVEADGERKLMRLNEVGRSYHASLVEKRECVCRVRG